MIEHILFGIYTLSIVIVGYLMGRKTLEETSGRVAEKTMVALGKPRPKKGKTGPFKMRTPKQLKKDKEMDAIEEFQAGGEGYKPSNLTDNTPPWKL